MVKGWIRAGKGGRVARVERVEKVIKGWKSGWIRGVKEVDRSFLGAGRARRGGMRA